MTDPPSQGVVVTNALKVPMVGWIGMLKHMMAGPMYIWREGGVR
jgi:hypothetical protein